MKIFFVGLLGWLGGILVNYLADILPNLRRLKRPVCVFCFEPQPLVNYLFWPRSCHQCQKHRPWRVWIIELSYILISIWFWQNPHPVLGYYFSLVLMLFFGVVLVVDVEHRLILHPVSITGALLGFGLGWRLHGFWLTVLGGAVGFASMYLLYILGGIFGRWLAKRRGETLNEVALGFGDVNLSGVLGLLLGWPGIVGGLILAVLIGGLVSFVYLIGMLVTRKYRNFATVPYGPFLVASAILLIFFKELWI